MTLPFLPVELEPASLERRRIVWLTIAAFWGIYFLVNTLRVAMHASVPMQFGLGLRRMAVSSAGVGLSWAFYRFVRPYDRAALSARIRAVALGALIFALAYATLNAIFFDVLAPKEYAMIGYGPRLPLVFLVLDYMVSWYFFFAAWGALYLALTYAERAVSAERAARDAELRALRYQINPHFLFNALNSLSALVMRGEPAAAERMLLKLSTFFRTSLATDAVRDVRLADEIALQRLYLEIEAVRFPERLRVKFAIPTQCETLCVPALILQPLIENAIKHGVARSGDVITLSVRADCGQGMLTLLVENDGPVATEPATEARSVGLRNVRARLAARFGEAAECAFGPRGGGGWRAALRFPAVSDGC